MTTTALTLYDAIKPATKLRELAFLAVANLLLVACAYVAVPLPFSPVPVTGQTFGVLVIAMALGRVRGTAVVAAYVMEGALGLPVFAGGTGGLPILLGPTGGYLLGFVAAAHVMGWLAEQGWHESFARTVGAMLVGETIIFTGGVAWLAMFVPGNYLLAAGLYPFVPGGVVKVAVASSVLPSLSRIVRGMK
jgi:biotin transport system substrate-specific component